ncbi:MAG: DUF362 domain-containing protein, partial [Clostridia bacterium]|nr:DUF362 domain-containing protein [Clostridia bacterium]
AQVPRGSYSPVVDLSSSADCGGKTLLYLVDGLFTTTQQNIAVSADGKFVTMDGDYLKSVFVSQDPVAIDSVCYGFLLAERDASLHARDSLLTDTMPPDHTGENYLHESALAYNPPSGVVYRDGKGNMVTSLGVHEHWNNPTDKQYSRNLGKDEGIELVTVTR